jgi:hypothetical protein
MATQYGINVGMSSETVSALRNGGFALYGFKAIQCSAAGGAPLVWFKQLSFMNQTQISWQEQYQAYVSTDQIISGGTVHASSAINIGLGQTATADGNGNLTASSNGTPGAVSILNQGSAPWTAGISQTTNGQSNPICALPLYGHMLDVLAPLEKVLLTFASNTVNTGAVLYRSMSSSVMIDLTDAAQRSVTFDINQGWSWDGGTWASSVEANAQLVPLLITGGITAKQVA